MKDHQIAALVNELRDIAVEFHGTQQLRERIGDVVRKALSPAYALPIGNTAELTPVAVSQDEKLSRSHSFVRSTLAHHGIKEVHTACVADLIYGLDEIREVQCAMETREALIDAVSHLAGAASAYRTFAKRHPSKGKAETDALFSTRAQDYDNAVARGRAALHKLKDAQ